MTEDSDDSRAVSRIIGIKEDIRTARTDAQRDTASRELVYSLNDLQTAEPDPIRAKVIQELNRNPHMYPDLLDVLEGNESKAADMVVQHMIELGKLGKSWVMSRAMAHLNELAHRVRFSYHRG